MSEPPSLTRVPEGGRREEGGEWRRGDDGREGGKRKKERERRGKRSDTHTHTHTCTHTHIHTYTHAHTHTHTYQLSSDLWLSLTDPSLLPTPFYPSAGTALQTMLKEVLAQGRHPGDNLQPATTHEGSVHSATTDCGSAPYQVTRCLFSNHFS